MVGDGVLCQNSTAGPCLALGRFWCRPCIIGLTCSPARICNRYMLCLLFRGEPMTSRIISGFLSNTLSRRTVSPKGRKATVALFFFLGTQKDHRSLEHSGTSMMIEISHLAWFGTAAFAFKGSCLKPGSRVEGYNHTTWAKEQPVSG